MNAATAETLDDIAAELFPDTHGKQTKEVQEVQDDQDEVLDAHESGEEEESDQEVEQQSVGDDDGAGENPSFETINDLLAEVVEPDDMEQVYNLPIKLDTGEQVPLGKVKDVLQNQSRQLNEQQQQLQAAQAALQENQQSNTYAPAIIEAEATMRSLADQWNHLEANKADYNSGDLALARQELESKFASAQNAKAQAQQQLQQAKAVNERKLMDAEVSQLLGVRPELKAEGAFSTALGRLEALGQAYGMNPREVVRAGMLNHRVGQMLMDLADLRERSATGKKALETGKRKTGLRLKPKARTDKAKVSVKRQKNLEAQAKANPRDKRARTEALRGIADLAGIRAR